ncbi:hypothetical protein ACFQ3Z_02075 [Streptomyces nogalater]
MWAAQKHELRQMRIQGSGAIDSRSSSAGWSACPSAPPTTLPSTV